MEKITNRKDALGNELIPGNKYGYNTDGNGIMYVILGKFLNFTKQGYASLEPYSKKQGIFNDELKDVSFSSKVSVKSGKLFPIND